MKAADITKDHGNGGYKLVIGAVAKIWIGVMTVLLAAMFTSMITLYARMAVIEERMKTTCLNLEKHFAWSEKASDEMLTSKEFTIQMQTVMEEISHLEQRIAKVEELHVYRPGRTGGNHP